MIALLQAKAEGLWSRSHIRNNVVAALTSLFGGTRVQISGPTGAFVAVLAIITAQHGIDGLQIATLMAGVILVAFGVSRLGAVIKYIPNPVIAHVGEENVVESIELALEFTRREKANPPASEHAPA
jgi:SulP family sulfate permease